MNKATSYYKSFRNEGTRPAAEAWASAKQHALFLGRLGAMVAETNKRAKAARKGWKRRKQNDRS